MGQIIRFDRFATARQSTIRSRPRTAAQRISARLAYRDAHDDSRKLAA